MRRGQTTLDFAIGVSIFILVIVFTFTFVPTTLQPFEESAQRETATADRIAEQLASEVLAEPTDPYVLDQACTTIFFESREDGNDPVGDDADNVDGDGTFSKPFGSGSYGGSCNFEDVSFDERLAIDANRLDIRIRLVRDLTTEESDNPRPPVGGDSDDANFGEPGDDGTDQDDSEVESLCLDENDNRIIEGDAPFTTGAQCDITSGDDDILYEIGDEPPNTVSVVSASRVVEFPGGFADGTSDATLVVEVW